MEGTGLGLALARRLVEAMGGTLSVTSQPERGTTCVVDLARYPSPRSWRIRPRRHARPRRRPRRAARDPLHRGQRNQPAAGGADPDAGRYPAAHGHAGRLGVEMAQVHVPDLVLLDVHLPDMLGDEVLRLLRSDPRTQHIPVVVISATPPPPTRSSA